MSTILKALRRVEEERPGAPAAPRRAMRGDFVAGSGAPPPRRGKRRGPNLKLWGSVAAVVLLAALVWWRLPRPEPELVQATPPARAERPPERAPVPAAPPSPAAPIAVAPPATVAVAPPAPPPRAEEPPAAAPPVAAANEVPVEVAERLPPLGAPLEAPPEAPEPAPPPAPSPARVSPPPAPAPDVAVVEPAPPPEAPAPRVVAPPPEPAVAKPQAKPKPAAAAAKPKPKPPPAPSVPGLEVERTSWHPKPERRIAWVRVEGLADTRELHEGDVVGPLVVKEIRPSSVVFQHGAQEIQRRVGEQP